MENPYALPSTLFAGLWLGLFAPPQAVQLRIEPEPVQQGGLLLVELQGAAPQAPPSCEWLGRSYSFYSAASGYRLLLPVDRQKAPGPAELVVRAPENSEPLARRTVSIVELETGPVEIVRLTPDRMALQKDPRLEEESRRIGEIIRTKSPGQLWKGSFQKPVDAAGANYGKQRRYVEATARKRRRRRSPSFSGYHRGLDFSLDRGAPVAAANAGQVLAAERFVLPGKAVFIDHGQGVITSYFHLEEIRVKPGDRVARGEVLGTVGSTGRSTGPHLHWSVYAQGQSVNPAAILALPERLTR